MRRWASRVVSPKSGSEQMCIHPELYVESALTGLQGRSSHWQVTCITRPISGGNVTVRRNFARVSEPAAGATVTEKAAGAAACVSQPTLAHALASVVPS